MMTPVTLSNLCKRYDAFLVDLWGVIHDGVSLYPNVIGSLEYLSSQKKKVLFLSNAPRRAARAQALLDNLGISRELYAAIVTSGEVAFHYIQNHPTYSHRPHYYIGPDRDRGMFDGLGTIETTDPAAAAFVLVTGFDHDDAKADDKNTELRAAFKHNLPLLCANPDLMIVRHSGIQALCAGIIARNYEAMGGQVEYFGKPFIHVYNRCLELLQIPKVSIAAIGDSLSHDIRGANNAGIDSYLVLQGIHAKEMNFSYNQPIDPLLFQHTCSSHGGTPTGVLEQFNI